MSDGPQSTGWANVTHAVVVHAVGACRVQNMTASDGGPLYVLTLIGRCRCGCKDETEQGALLRDADVVNVIAALTSMARGTGLGDTLADRVETVIEDTDRRCGAPLAAELVLTCTGCGQRVDDCCCTARVPADA